MNNYRATGTGGYDAYKSCPVVREQPTEIVELIMDYIETHRQITVDKTKWLTVLE
jgi:2',3'-cyclic-nucleotide 2'-phosphodiesterase/3'-nucleotidase